MMLKKMKKVRIGIIGCGGFGNVHLDNLLKIEAAEVTALSSRNAESLSATSKKLGSPLLFENYKAMLESGAIDAAVVCVPPDGHGNIEEAAAENGIHLYIEKPIGLDWARIKHNEEIIEKAGIICSVGYQGRYSEQIEKIKLMTEQKMPRLALAEWINGFPGAEWWRVKSRSGGQIVEQSTHFFDILRYFFGEAKSVFSSGAPADSEIIGSDVESCSSTVITFYSGVIATVLSGCYINSQRVESTVGIDLFFEDKRINLKWGGELTISSNSGITTESESLNNHFRAMQAFVTAVQTNNPTIIRSDYSDAAKTLGLTLAANESMKTNSLVMLKGL